MTHLARIACSFGMVSLLGLGSAEPVQAGNAGRVLGGAIGGFIGVMGGLATVGPARPYRDGTRQRRNTAKPAADPNAVTEKNAQAVTERNSAVLARLAPSTQVQVAVLKGVIASASLGAVGSTDDLNVVGETASGERDRDYTAKIQDLIDRFKRQQSAQKSYKEGDITEHAIQQSVTAVYKTANLQRFETFLGENWSAERLRGMIVDRAATDVGGLFDGTNKGLVSMADLDSIIQKAGRSVYLRLFETSELLAANRSSALFIQRLYQTHGDLVSGDLREGAERLLLRASTSGSAQFDGIVRRDDNAFALRYRIQRIIFDCLSENVEAVTSSDTGVATVVEIEQRVFDVTTDRCVLWVSNQIRTDDGKLKAQEPMPLRVIWSEAGPKDDPSMYGRASGLL
ncbi:MAG: hypothetical protein U1E62_07865 [Alsobacter sp.]